MPLTPTTFELGTTLGGIASLASLGLLAPESQYIDFSQRVVSADGIAHGLGYPSAVWHYGFMSQAEYDILRGIIPSLGKAIFISTLNNDGDYKTFACNAAMPETFTMRGPDSKIRYIDVSINFTHLVIQ